MMYQAAVLTVSDRSAQGQRPDTAGPLVAQLLEEAGYAGALTAIVPDEQTQIEEFLKSFFDLLNLFLYDNLLTYSNYGIKM